MRQLLTIRGRYVIALLLFLSIPKKGVAEVLPNAFEKQQTSVEQPADTLMTDSTFEEDRREFLAVKSNLLLDVAYMPGYNRWCSHSQCRA